MASKKYWLKLRSNLLKEWVYAGDVTLVNPWYETVFMLMLPYFVMKHGILVLELQFLCPVFPLDYTKHISRYL